jgi:menaquinone-specific isochorismate synthase
VTGPLVARTRRLDDEIDLLTVAGSDGVLVSRGGSGLAGRGEALRIAHGPEDDPADTVGAALGAIEVDDELGRPGCGPVGFAALPFDPGRTGTVIVPEMVVGRADDGTRWVTTVAPVGAPTPDLAAPIIDQPGPARVEIAAVRPAADWCASVSTATDAIRAGRLDKVVLAREITVTADRPIAVATVLDRLRTVFPGCWITSVDGVIGASPELLVARRGDVVRSHPLAGTAPRGGDPTTDAQLAARLLASTKNREEHQITIDEVHETLLPWCSYLDSEAEPSIVAVANVQHLGTMVEGRLSDPPPSVLELVRALHPTPAVCGRPRDPALALIDEVEQLDRGSYAGPVGWVDHRGNGEWAVGIRSATIDGPVARLRAGNGIVADSDPRAELAETQAKLQALLGVLIRL